MLELRGVSWRNDAPWIYGVNHIPAADVSRILPVPYKTIRNKADLDINSGPPASGEYMWAGSTSSTNL
jgi:hypothetical protein